MEANNFRLFEVVDETIRDIFNFLMRYLNTLWVLLTSPKKLFDICHTEEPYKKIVRPFNFMLISIILLAFGIELLDYGAVSGFFEAEENKQSDTLNSLMALDGTTLVIKFLPAILLIIIISRFAENLINWFYKTDKSFSLIYLYGVGYSFSFYFLIVIAMNSYDEFLYENTSGDMDTFLVILAIVILLYLIIFPTFLLTRSLKYVEVKLLKRSINFVFFFFFNIGLVIVFFNMVSSSTESDFVSVNVFHTEQTQDGLELSFVYSDNTTFVPNQGEYLYLNAYSYPYDRQFGFTATFDSAFAKKHILLRPNNIHTLNLTLDTSYYNMNELDSLFNIYTEFNGNLFLQDAEANYTYINFKFGKPY